MIKDGIKTTEFWVTIASQLVGLLVLFGLFNSDQAETVKSAVGYIAGGIIQLVPVALYIWGRVKVKAAAIERA